MKVLILGATGKTGKLLVQGALERGMEVTAFVRNAKDFSLTHKRLRVVEGDIREPQTLDAAMEGQEVVLNAVGSGDMKPSEIRRLTARVIVEAMERRGVRRLISMSGLGAGETKEQLPWFARNVIVPLILKHLLADQTASEHVIRNSSLDWTIVRPGELKDKGSRRPTKISLDGGKVSMAVHRQDVADFMLSLLSDGKFHQKAVCVGY